MSFFFLLWLPEEWWPLWFQSSCDTTSSTRMAEPDAIAAAKHVLIKNVKAMLDLTWPSRLDRSNLP